LQNVGHLLSRTTGFGLSITLCCDSPAWSGDQTALSTPAMLKQCQPPRLPKSAPFDLVHYPPRTTALGCVSAREGLLDSAIPTGVTCLNDLQLHYFVDPSILYYTVCNAGSAATGKLNFDPRWQQQNLACTQLSSHAWVFSKLTASLLELY